MKEMLLFATTATVFALVTLAAQDQVRTGTTDGDLQSNLSILNLFGEQPESMRQLYSTAYNVLALDPQANFTDVPRDPEIRRL